MTGRLSSSTRTCRTSRSAPPRAGASARPSSRRRAIASCRRTIRRSNCASWRTSPKTQACSTRSRRARTSIARRRREVFGVPLAEVTQRTAALCEGHQLRPDLRHERVRPGVATSASNAMPPGATSTATSCAIPAWRSTWSDTRALAKRQGYVETVFGRRLWLPEINSPNGPRRRRRRTRGHQCADAGHRGRSDQARDDRGRALDRRRGTAARGSSCRCTTSWCSRCRRPKSKLVRERVPALMCGVAAAARAAGRRCRRRR